MKRTPNRHKHPRRTSYIIAEYTVREGKFRDVISNIGSGGLFIRTSRKVAVDQAIKLTFPLLDFDSTISVSGKVIRRDHKGFAVSFDNTIKELIGVDGSLTDIVHEGDR
jgi:hypothetical protein